VTKEKPDPKVPMVSTAQINFYPIAIVKDNVMINDAHGKEEEWL
jgi:hypothetical protein